jgi:hypothetical protein
MDVVGIPSSASKGGLVVALEEVDDRYHEG